MRHFLFAALGVFYFMCISGEDILRAGARLSSRPDGTRDEAALRGCGAHAEVRRNADERDSPEAVQ